MGGTDNNPTAVQAKTRLRLLLMGAAPSVAAATHEKPKAAGASVLLEEEEPTYLSAATLDLDGEPPAEEISRADITMMDGMVSGAQPRPAPPAGAGPAAAAIEDAGQLVTDDSAAVTAGRNLSREALAYVAGYVATKCRDTDETLGRTTSEASTEPRDERCAWIEALSRGDLTVPSRRWLNQVEELEVLFAAMHGAAPGIDRGHGVVRRLAEAAALKCPDRHPRVLRKYAMTRTQLRVRELQRSVAREQAKKAAGPSRRAAKRARMYVPPRLE